MTISTLNKRIVTLFSFCVLCLFVFSGCGNNKSSLQNATVEEIGKQIFAESNYCQNAIFMSDGDYEFLNISYSNDKYDRYLVCIDLKTSVGMKYETLPIYIFFRYNASINQYTWHPQMIFSEEYSEDAFKKAVNWNKETTWAADEDAFRRFLDNNDSSNSDNENELTPDDANAILREHIRDSISADFVNNIYILHCLPFADGHNPGMLNLAIEISLSATSERAYAIGQIAYEILDAIPQGLVLQKQEYETMHLSLEFKCADNGIYNHYNYYLYDKHSEKYVGNGSGTVYEKQEGAFLFAPADKMTREANLVFENGFKGNGFDLYEQLQQGTGNISSTTVSVTGVVVRYEYGWFISLSEPLTVEDAGDMVDCDELYFYEDVLDGRAISDFEGATVVISGTPENYKDAGTYFLNNPVLKDVHAKPSAKWEEMPLHKCIYCGEIARLTSGAWCCDNCFAVYGEENFSEKVSFDAFAKGIWWDTYSKRCNLTIDVIDDETIAIEINWSSSASENTRWIISATWDSYWGLMRYENGIKQIINDLGTTTIYENGSGFFYINSGNLYWVDYEENAGFNCVFELPTY